MINASMARICLSKMSSKKQLCIFSFTLRGKPPKRASLEDNLLIFLQKTNKQTNKQTQKL